MQSMFASYYPLSREDKALIGTDSIVALDASALLHAYRLAPNTAIDWLDMLDALGDRLWVPHQAALEYQRNRIRVVARQGQLVRDTKQAVEKALDSLHDELLSHKSDIDRSRVLDWIALSDAVGNAKAIFASIFESAEANVVDITEAAAASDEIHSRQTQMLTDRVGPPPTMDELDAAYAWGKCRFAEKIPPGFADESSKGGDDRRTFGDLIIWFQLLDRAALAELPAVLVTQDKKEDWWRKEAGQTLGPLPALREEFASRVGQPFWLYTVAGLMRSAEHFGLVPARCEAVNDAEALELERPNAHEVHDTRQRLGEFVQALEQFADPNLIPDDELREHILPLLANWVEAELA
ncbi:PIN-like domain-containing protein [Candidatus Poriferisocius sp.]|uniref:PIN-like domain-containing protein n=1 Tax=Candidatus Poriferisocius sp. TaxID=3101276 RepID=UPI003B01C8AB